jgi:carboxyl-terminal processing protease
MKISSISFHLLLLASLAAPLPSCASGTKRGPEAEVSKPAAAPSTAPTRTPLTLAERREVFDAAWKEIREKHFDPKMNGVDWDAVHARTAPKVDAAHDDEEFTDVMAEMILTLGQSHIGIAPPQADVETSKSDAQGTVGLHAGFVEGKLVVTRVEPGSPADLAHVAPGTEILTVGGKPVSKILEDLPRTLGERWQGVVPYVVDDAIRGPVGEKLRIGIAAPDGAPREIDLVRVEPRIPAFRFGYLGTIPVEFESRMLPGEIVYVRFTPCIIDAGQNVERALAEHANARGAILDLRGNPGGVGAVAMAVARLFVDKPVDLGTMHTRENPEIRFFVHADDTPFRGPLVILVDASSASTSEILAGGLQLVGRARIVGERSIGMALPSLGIELPHRWRLQTVFADFQLPNGKAIEGNGVTPDVAVATTLADLRARRDPALDAAVAELARAPTAADVAHPAEERLHAAPAAASASPVDVSPEAEAVLAKFATAMKADRMAAHKTMRVNAKISMMGMEGTVETTREAPDKMRTHALNPLAGELIQTYDGQHGWSSNAIQGLRELQGPQLAVAKRGARFDPLVAWRDLFAKVELLDRREVDGKNAYVLKLTSHEGEGEPVVTFLDPETYLPFRSEFTIESEMGKVHVAAESSDYKEFDGVPQATKTVTKINGLDLVVTVENVEWDVDVDPAQFAKPPKIEKPAGK